MSLTEYEREREARVARNKAMLHSTVTAKLPVAAGPAPPQRRRTAKAPRGTTDVARRSHRLGGMTLPSYAEAGRSAERAPRRLAGAPRTVVPDGSKPTLEEVEAMTPEELAKFAVGGGINSGKGRRAQGGRVYDSECGATCHWCRQKTVEMKVVCTHSLCGVGRLPVLMCASCLANRHGECVYAAISSGDWVCPRCRDGCCAAPRHTPTGPDAAKCIGCCNCSACRKKAAEPPTGLIKHDAYRAGFTNAHDYLAGMRLGKSQKEMDAVRVSRGWAKWSLDPAIRALAPAAAAQAGPFALPPPCADGGAAAAAAPPAPSSPVLRAAGAALADVSADTSGAPVAQASDSSGPPGCTVERRLTGMYRAVRKPAEQMQMVAGKAAAMEDAATSKRRRR